MYKENCFIKFTGWLRTMSAGRIASLFLLTGSMYGIPAVQALELPAAVNDADYYNGGTPNPARVELGNMLFFDKILSGNRNMSCGTCHHVLMDTGDGLSLPVGEGGAGLGVTRDTGSGADAIVERVPRNAPPVFNLGAVQFSRLFHDGRVEVDATFPSGVKSPAGHDLPEGLENPLAVQAMFPVTSATEMAGQAGENSIADAAAAGNLAGSGGVWDLLALRLQAIDKYVELFKAAFDDINAAEDIRYVHAANAIAAFEAQNWRADNSPFDQYLRGDKHALSKNAKQGMKLFYGKANCHSCHSGPFQTDHSYHAIAMPQIGPGKGNGESGHEDHGRINVSGAAEDLFRFRTPTLRNVALTGPWGHAGAYDSLEAVVRHHLDPVAGLEAYDRSQSVLPYREDLAALDFVVQEDPVARGDIANANELAPLALSDTEVTALLDFLQALTDPSSIDLRRDMPERVPSGLPLAD